MKFYPYRVTFENNKIVPCYADSYISAAIITSAEMLQGCYDINIIKIERYDDKKREWRKEISGSFQVVLRDN